MNLSGKQKSFLRKLAQTLKPIFQIGKDGLSDTLSVQILNYLKKYELVKVSVLDTCPIEKTELIHSIETAGMNVVQTIGKTIVLYRPSYELASKIELPR